MLTVSNFNRNDIGNWRSDYIPEMGTIGWSNYEYEGVHVYATPSYKNDDETKVEIYYESNGEIVDMGSWVHKIGTDKEKNEFVRSNLKNLFEFIAKMGGEYYENV